jgi:predicted transcriptional regulator
MKTIDLIKEKRKVSEELKNRVKEFGKINRAILNALKEKDKTIPQIAEETMIEPNVVTYHLMTLIKYGKIEVGEIDDMDEYYYYKLSE